MLKSHSKSSGGTAQACKSGGMAGLSRRKSGAARRLGVQQRQVSRDASELSGKM